MQATVLTEFGPAENLRLSPYADPVAEPGWAVVELRASALNWHDVLVRQGKYNSPLPHVPGADGAGLRVDTGEEVVVIPSLWWGDDERAPRSGWEILGDHRPGTYAELVRVPTECLAPKPAGYSWAEAAALPLVGVTTYRALFTRAQLASSESVLVLGAGGGVATMAVSMAAGIGASAVVTSSAQEKIARSKQLGAIGGVLYTDPDWVAAAKSLSPGGKGFDVVLDSVGSWRESIAAMKPGGRLVVLGASRGEQVSIDTRPFYFGQYSLLGTTMGSVQDFAGLLSLLDKERIAAPVIDRSFSLSEAGAAHAYLETGAAFGKVVLNIS
jgi:NADPH:quinone reductase-like Zn-dependent oxidoreductase